MSECNETYLQRNLFSIKALQRFFGDSVTSCLHFVTILTDFPFSFWLDSHPPNYDRLDVMKKVWVYKRTNTKSWWVGWYEGGIRKTKVQHETIRGRIASKQIARSFSFRRRSSIHGHCNARRRPFDGQVRPAEGIGRQPMATGPSQPLRVVLSQEHSRCHQPFPARR